MALAWGMVQVRLPHSLPAPLSVSGAPTSSSMRWSSRASVRACSASIASSGGGMESCTGEGKGECSMKQGAGRSRTDAWTVVVTTPAAGAAQRLPGA